MFNYLPKKLLAVEELKNTIKGNKRHFKAEIFIYCIHFTCDDIYHQRCFIPRAREQFKQQLHTKGFTKIFPTGMN